jgi:hypothetical protein
MTKELYEKLENLIEEARKEREFVLAGSLSTILGCLVSGRENQLIIAMLTVTEEALAELEGKKVQIIPDLPSPN